MADTTADRMRASRRAAEEDPTVPVETWYRERIAELEAKVAALLQLNEIADRALAERAGELGFYEGHDVGRIDPNLSPAEYCKRAEEFAKGRLHALLVAPDGE